MYEMLVDVPKEMLNFCRSPDAKKKPYDVCLRCPYIRESCDGPNILAMDYQRWVEWANGMAKKNSLTRAAIAEASGIPLSTVTNALSGHGYDVRTDTMRQITKVIIGGCWGQYPCHMAAMLIDGEVLEQGAEARKISDLQDEVDRLNAELKRVIESSDARVREAKEEAQVKIDNLKKQVKDWQEESRIRDKYLAEKNKTIDNLVNVLIKEKIKE